MFLRSRVVPRGTAAASTYGGISSRHRAPMLFLYPRWFATATEKAEYSEDDGLRSPSTAPQSLGKKKLESLYNEDETTFGSFESFRTGYAAASLTAAQTQGDDYAEDGTTGIDALQLSETPSTTTDGKASRKVGTIARRVLGKLARRSRQRAYKQEVREEYQEEKRLERGAPVADWRGILRDLEVHTPNWYANSERKTLRILVPVKFAGQLIYSQDHNIWAIKHQYGCDIEFSEADESDEKHRALLLSGTGPSITEAAAKIFRLVPDAMPEAPMWHHQPPKFNTKAPLQDHISSIDGEIIRFVRASQYRDMATPIRVDKVARPSKWTAASFGHFVEHLTTIKMSSHNHMFFYTPGEHHVEMVVTILRNLFADPVCQEAISISALNDAMRYLTKHNQIKAVRELFVCVEMLGLKMNTETFNIMLRGAAKSADLHTFKFILGLMLRRGYKPDGSTWEAFIMALRTWKIKLHVQVAMRQNGLLNSTLMQRRICQQFVAFEVDRSLRDNQPQEEFLQHMAARWDKDWLTISSANRVLDMLGSRGLISRCWDFLRVMDAQNVKADVVSINTILYHCEQLDNREGAIEIISRIASLQNFVPDEHTYSILFNIAWKSHLYTVARIIWRYACLEGATTFRMRKRIVSNLQTAIKTPDPPSLNESSRWKARAGQFIIGISPSRHVNGPHLHMPLPLLNRVGQRIKQHPILLRSLKKPASSKRSTDPNAAAGINQAIHLVMKLHMQLFKDWVPERPFADVLSEAFENDKMPSASGLERLNANAPVMILRRRVQSDRRARVVRWK